MKRIHPDTGQSHWVIYNNFALHQHRNLKIPSLGSRKKIGVFGDSFVENLRLPVQHSFTEILDFLLNSNRDEFQVFNFGVDGYGTDQSFIYYTSSQLAQEMNYVFYFFCKNDLSDIFKNKLFFLDEKGVLIRKPAPKAKWWVSCLSRFYTTYFIADAFARMLGKFGIEIGIEGPRLDKRFLIEECRDWDLDNKSNTQIAEKIERAFIRGEKMRELSSSILLFKKILWTWKDKVEQKGGSFVIVLLPRVFEAKSKWLFEGSFSFLELYSEFNGLLGSNDIKKWTFKNDHHWNETGNLYAAWAMYRYLEACYNLQVKNDDWIIKRLCIFYSAFPQSWLPGICRQLRDRSPKIAKSIRRKYLELELEGK